jgi:trehalose 6-phosphate phosphatase
MSPLFSHAGLQLLEALSFTQSLYAFDFDGTLSKIVPVPDEAKLSRTTESLMRELSALVPIAILSGRSIEDLRQRLTFKPAFLIGNHGLEGVGRNQSMLSEAEAACAEWKGKLAQLDLGVGVEIEDKKYSLAIHYRRSRKKKWVREEILRAVARLRPEPRTVGGKSVVNVLPLGAPHKGMAVLSILKKGNYRGALYIGDDDTDEDVFGLPDNPVVVTVRVGKKRNSQARFFIQRQVEINRLLQHLIRHHRGRLEGGKSRSLR